MMRHRSSSWLLSAESQRPDAFGGGFARRHAPAAFLGHRRNLAVGRIHDERRAQVRRLCRLAAIETELAEVVVDVFHRARLGLRLFARGGGLADRGGLFGRVELLRDAVRPLERHVGGVGPEALQIGLAVGRARLHPRARGLTRESRERHHHGGDDDPGPTSHPAPQTRKRSRQGHSTAFRGARGPTVADGARKTKGRKRGPL